LWHYNDLKWLILCPWLVQGCDTEPQGFTTATGWASGEDAEKCVVGIGMREGITQSESPTRKQSAIDNLNLIEQWIGGCGICWPRPFQRCKSRGPIALI